MLILFNLYTKTSILLTNVFAPTINYSFSKLLEKHFNCCRLGRGESKDRKGTFQEMT